MKKLFGVVGLLFCVFLASCNFNNLSGKGGDIEFSIPLNDIVKLAEQRASREGGEEKQFEFVAMLQVKGSKNYYKSKTETYDFGNSFYDGKAKTIEMSMSSLPSNQTYTVMFDLFVVNSVYKDSWWEVSGRTPNVAVTAGKTEEISLTAARSNEALVYLKVELEKSESPIDLSERDIINIQKESDGLYFREQKIKDIYLVLNSNANFTDSSFKYTLEYFSDSEGKNLGSSDLKFKNDVCSIKDFLMNQSYFKSNEITISKGDISFFTWLPHIVVKASNNSNPGFDPSILGYKRLVFTKAQDNPDGTSRYCAIVPFADMNILDGQGDVVTVPENGKTVFSVVIFSDYGNSPIRRIERLYYMLYEGNEVADGETYAGNQCITLPPRYDGEYSLIMPFNNLQMGVNIKGYWMFFFDINSNATEYEMYYFAAGSLLPLNTYVFSRVSNWAYEQGTSTEPWVNELKVPMVDTSNEPLANTLQEHDDVWVTMRGIFSAPENVSLYGEIYDAALYKDGKCYHTFSNTEEDNGSDPTGLSNANPEYSEVQFRFNDIVALSTNLVDGAQHDCYFQCQSSCDLNDEPLVFNGTGGGGISFSVTHHN